jgi:hypothetical protein
MSFERAGPRTAAYGICAALALGGAMAAGPARALMVDDEFLHLSATLGRSADSGVVVGPGQYIGSIFELGQRSRIAQLGGALLGRVTNAQVIAAVVPMGADLVPDFAPAELQDNLLATAILTLPNTSSVEVLAPVIGEVFLDAGRYALVFASALEVDGVVISGAGEAPQSGDSVADVSPTTPGADRARFFSSLTPSVNPWTATNIAGARFLVSGQAAPPPPVVEPPVDAAVPAPPAGLLLLSALAAGAAVRRRGRGERSGRGRARAVGGALARSGRAPGRRSGA